MLRATVGTFFLTGCIIFSLIAIGASFQQKTFLNRPKIFLSRLSVSTISLSEDELLLTENLKPFIRTIKGIHDDRLKYEQLLHYATMAEPMPNEYKTPENKVRGCLSTVYVHAMMDNEGKIFYHGDSDSVLTKGLVSILVKGLSGNTPEAILEVKKEFIGYTGFSLTAGRNNGFLNMLLHMQKQAKELLLRSTSVPPTIDHPELHHTHIGPIQEKMQSKLMLLKPSQLTIENISYQHSGHEGVQGFPETGETHFKVKVVAECFEGVSLVNRHKLIYTLLGDELKTTVHALSIDALTPKEVNI